MGILHSHSTPFGIAFINFQWISSRFVHIMANWDFSNGFNRFYIDKSTHLRMSCDYKYRKKMIKLLRNHIENTIMQQTSTHKTKRMQINRVPAKSVNVCGLKCSPAFYIHLYIEWCMQSLAFYSFCRQTLL